MTMMGSHTESIGRPRDIACLLYTSISVSQKPVGRVRIKKMIDNYDNTLANDEFMMRINSVSGTAVSSQVVLKHNETSGYVEIKEPTWLNIVEILPMEYSFIEITIEGTGCLLYTSTIFTDLHFPEKASGEEGNPLFQYAIFKVKDVDAYDRVKADIQKVDIGWERYDLIDNNGNIKSMAENFNDMEKISRMLLL